MVLTKHKRKRNNKSKRIRFRKTLKGGMRVVKKVNNTPEDDVCCLCLEHIKTDSYQISICDSVPAHYVHIGCAVEFLDNSGPAPFSCAMCRVLPADDVVSDIEEFLAIEQERQLSTMQRLRLRLVRSLPQINVPAVLQNVEPTARMVATIGTIHYTLQYMGGFRQLTFIIQYMYELLTNQYLDQSIEGLVTLNIVMVGALMSLGFLRWFNSRTHRGGRYSVRHKRRNNKKIQRGGGGGLIEFQINSKNIHLLSEYLKLYPNDIDKIVLCNINFSSREQDKERVYANLIMPMIKDLNLDFTHNE